MKQLVASVQLLSDTISGVNINTAATLNLDGNGVAISVETQLDLKEDQATYIPTLSVNLLLVLVVLRILA